MRTEVLEDRNVNFYIYIYIFVMAEFFFFFYQNKKHLKMLCTLLRFGARREKSGEAKCLVKVLLCWGGGVL